MVQIMSDLKFCINFVQRVPLNAPFIYFTPSTPSSTPPLCSSFHGFVPSAEARGQAAIVFGSSTFTQSNQTGNTKGACLDNPTSPRDAMRVIANALGLRNEFMRSDRDNFITLAPNANSLVAANLQSLDIFAATKKYTNASATNQGPFDARSITMVTGEQWAQNIGKPVFTLNMNPTGGGDYRPVGNLARLSRTDCDALNMLYRCRIQCDDRKFKVNDDEYIPAYTTV